MFENELESHGTVEADWVRHYLGWLRQLIFLQRAAMHTAVSAVLQRSDLLSRCDHVQVQAGIKETGEGEAAVLSSSESECDYLLIC